MLTDINLILQEQFAIAESMGSTKISSEEMQAKAQRLSLLVRRVRDLQEESLAPLREEYPVAFQAWLENVQPKTRDADVLRRTFTESFAGQYPSVADYAREYLDSFGALNQLREDLVPYFDFRRYGRDMERRGDIWAHVDDDSVYVFRTVKI